MDRVLSKDTLSRVGEEVYLKGWIFKIRDLGKIVFVVIRDRAGLIQVVVEQPEEIAKLSGLQVGSVVYVKGTVKVAKTTELGVEIVNPSLEVAVPIREAPPIEYNKDDMGINVDTLLDYRPVSLRNRKVQAIFKTQAEIVEGFRRSLRNQGFTEYRSPIMIGCPSESGADVFEVKYFKDIGYLAQSPQLHKQIMLLAFERVFTITTAFRAEKHSTTRHLLEATQMDAELAFIDTYKDAMAVAERTIKEALEFAMESCRMELELCKVELPQIPEEGIPTLKVAEALKIIEARTGKSAAREGLDLDPDDERELYKWSHEKYNSDFLWVTHFKKDKNFYTWNTEDGTESISYDMIFRGLEILSGTHRIHIYDKLVERMDAQKLSKKYYEHYLQAFRYGMPNEAGFSFGLERVTKQLFGLGNIREATLFPSDLTRIAGARIVK